MMSIFRRTNQIAFGASMLALTMAFGSMPARSALISYDLSYAIPTTSSQGTGNTTSAELTVIFDDSVIDTNNSFQLISAISLEVTFTISGIVTSGTIQTDNTDIVFFPITNHPFVPVFGAFQFGDFDGGFFGPTGGFNARQPAIGMPGIVSVGFGFDAGNLIAPLFIAGNPFGKFNTQVDVAILASVSGPTTLSDPGNGTGVPEPGTLALFGIGLAGLGLMRRRHTHRR